MKYYFWSILILLGLVSCKKNKSSDPKPDTPIETAGGDQEVITRAVLRLQSANDTVYATFNDPKGNGTNVTVDTIKLVNRSSYSGQLKIYDDTRNPSRIVSDEIFVEANYHRFHYSFSPNTGSLANITFTITDMDSNSPAQPLGLNFNLNSGTNAGNGKLRINLRHFGIGETKSADPTAGEQDLLIDFPVILK